MESDVELRLRADSDAWRRSQAGAPVPEFHFDPRRSAPPSRRRWIAVAASVAAAVLVAVGVAAIHRPPVPRPAGPVREPALVGTVWQLVSSQGPHETTPTPVVGRSTLTVDGHGNYRVVECSTFDGTAVIGANTVVVSALDRNIVGCDDMVDGALRMTLSGTVGWAIHDRLLTLSRNGYRLTYRVATAEPPNMKLAEAETQRLVGLAKLPPGSAPLAKPPAALSGPTMGTPMDASLVMTTRIWRVPIAFDDAVSWIKAHAPAGLTSQGSSGGTGPGGASAGVAYSAPDGVAWTQAQLEIGATPSSGGGSIWRIDGLALWLDPTPVRVPHGGPRMALTVAGGCPASDSGFVDVAPASPPNDARLLPGGSPVSALICVYYGMNGKPSALKTSKALSAADAARLASLANAVSLAHTEGGVHSCPADDDSSTVLAFHYPSGADAGLWYHRTGCTSISNGTIIVGGGQRGAGELFDVIGQLSGS
jgi:hypothetical protein